MSISNDDTALQKNNSNYCFVNTEDAVQYVSDLLRHWADGHMSTITITQVKSDPSFAAIVTTESSADTQIPSYSDGLHIT